MRSFILASFLAAFVLFIGCGEANSQNAKYLLDASSFAQKVKSTPDAVIVDVRTPVEYIGGHLENAQNIDWRGNDFEVKTGKIDKSKPVFIYCQSGGRSASAVSKLREDGWKEVYELEGGISSWKSANLPVKK